MNLFHGEIVDLCSEDGMPLGRVLVGGAVKKLSLVLVADARPGETVLVCDGIALSKVCDAKKLVARRRRDCRERSPAANSRTRRRESF